ncbi:MotA/TolQ/ExbB proton channel family protein [Thiobacillus sedimenti]|uniref:Biopolymer transport protein ExbB n=1 Tax=Thiobacillus sedimenti TaxID=3110231 RepID=A0ABZ1CLW1_9PROT|nr:MotA/TolQ/ExbB proton channel family protein [Thiobacillus sp. SCUT-2]WRS40189.1 MotA/TolQ/ExbB proton channel family protein [Thiobacillus sp. SCUT-2]
MDNTLGFAHFLSHSDALGRIVLVLLLALSVASWYLIVTKALANHRAGRRAETFLRQFWAADSLQDIAAALRQRPADNAFAELAQAALDAAHEHHQHGVQKLAAAGGLGEFLTRLLRNGIDQEAMRVERGLTVMASAGSAAPYIGLFGTVWGIYHALLAIGLSGQGTLDKVSGPVGEALIMTALGLAVAIPAVLAYNAFNRRNRVWLARLDGFAHDLYTVITVGERASRPAAVVHPLRAAPPVGAKG